MGDKKICSQCQHWNEIDHSCSVTPHSKHLIKSDTLACPKFKIGARITIDGFSNVGKLIEIKKGKK